MKQPQYSAEPRLLQPHQRALTHGYLVERFLDARPIFIASARHERHLDAAIDLGAKGFLIKPVEWDELTDAIAEIAAGGAYFSTPLRSRLQFVSGRVGRSEMDQENALTDRQLEVLRMIAEGMSKRTIAKNLSISEKTVEGHTDKVMAKLNIHDRVGLARHAIRVGVIAP